MKYIKKAIPVNAFQWTREASRARADWPDWIREAVDKLGGGEGSLRPSGDSEDWTIQTLEGPHIVIPDAWIVQGPNPPHEIWAVRDDIFRATYEVFEE